MSNGTAWLSRWMAGEQIPLTARVFSVIDSFD